MKRSAFGLVVSAVLFAGSVCPAAAATWSDQNLVFNYYFPTYGNVFTGSPISFVADGSQHLSTLANLFPATFSVASISQSEMQISYSYPQQTSTVFITPASFNGFTISGPLADSPILSVFLDPSSNVAGLTNSNLSFTTDSVTVNLVGATYQVGSVGLIDVQFAPLPEALPLLASGVATLALLGWRRKRNAQALV